MVGHGRQDPVGLPDDSQWADDRRLNGKNLNIWRAYHSTETGEEGDAQSAADQLEDVRAA